MTLTESPRVAPGRPRPVARPLPLRHPDASDREVMTRRGWWLVVLNWLIPGSAQVLAGNRKLGRFGLGATLAMWVLIALVVAGLLLARTFTLSVLLNSFVLVALAIVVVAYGVLWIILSLDALRLVRLVKTQAPGRFLIAALSIVLMVVSGSAAGFVAPRLIAAGGALNIFGGGGPIQPADGYYNVLLLGGDSSEGRDSMRFDSVSVVSVNADTGKVTIFGLPREMQNVPFEEGSPMHERYPDGFQGQSGECGWNGWLNHVRQAVEVCDANGNFSETGGTELYPDAAAQGSAPGIEATKDAAEGALGIDIEHYVLLDMHGFASLVDALGGVEIDVKERLPKGDGHPGPVEDWATGWIEPGLQTMDGDTAQWYARSRYTTTDWDRMRRQRELQAAIIDQFTPQNVLSNFEAVARAGEDLVKTDLPQSDLPGFFDLATKAKEQEMASIELTPDNGYGADGGAPDYAAVREAVSSALHPEGE
ncbi:LCP family protein [Microbacterium halophytorum]|uniref:LCP family protein n=1 Tax=Microbacterium halophytorum TaxID=2067568 RepID=UPI000CFAF332|nr:LCP family protein [Microbacterium halophytorum]